LTHLFSTTATTIQLRGCCAIVVVSVVQPELTRLSQRAELPNTNVK